MGKEVWMYNKTHTFSYSLIHIKQRRDDREVIPSALTKDYADYM